MTTVAEAAAALDDKDGVYTLHLTREEGLDALRALDDWAGRTPASGRVMQRLAARLYPEQEAEEQTCRKPPVGSREVRQAPPATGAAGRA
ncbi:hypothetical protein ABT081_17360 [Streptomyces sp. NPDC002238]|uniref:hypothetical protein n=1 Tax=Streptomyces sp. NPDC002238 TaxID=3156649 RepID=UPI00331CAFEF